MSNSNDPKKGFSRFASSANADNNAQEGNSSRSPLASNQSGVFSFTSRSLDPQQSRFAARMQQANATPESAASIFSRKMAALEAQKKADEIRHASEANYVNPAQTLLEKITKPSSTPTSTTAARPQTTGGQLSFKERMEALNKRQEEIRIAASSTKATTPSSVSQSTAGQSTIGQSTFGQASTGQSTVKTAPIFASQTSRPSLDTPSLGTSSLGTSQSPFSSRQNSQVSQIAQTGLRGVTTGMTAGVTASMAGGMNAGMNARQTSMPTAQAPQAPMGTSFTRAAASFAPNPMQTPSTAPFMERKPLFTATRTGTDSPIATRSNPIVPTQTKGDFKISTEEFIELRDFLYEQAGIFVAENRKYLMENRLSSRLRELGLRNFHEYHKYLKFDNNRKEELNKLFENMTTNETSFFRNNPQLDIFRDKVLAKVINEQRAKGQKKIHIWSAGCSSGEEPYTISMIIHELLKNEVDSWDIKITANDLSLAMLATARKALYSEYALRTTPQDMINKYFTKEGKMFKVLPKVQKLVNFSQINLASSEQLAKVERSQIVFCRNVIIYFDDEMKRHVISSFYDNLLPGGYLLIGHSESLHSISRAFVPEHFTGAIVYGKKS